MNSGFGRLYNDGERKPSVSFLDLDLHHLSLSLFAPPPPPPPLSPFPPPPPRRSHPYLSPALVL